MSESKELTLGQPKASLSPWSSAGAFETAQRMAQAFASSDLVPQQYRGNVANSLIALEVAARIGASPLMVAQNLNIIHGRPSWSSTFIIASINSCGRFEPLRFSMAGEGDDRSCIAWTKDRSGEKLEGPLVSIRMAKAEGWYEKNPKWRNGMSEPMLRYRAAAFFGRLYAPDILMGMRSDDEEREIIDVTPEPQAPAPKARRGGESKSAIAAKLTAQAAPAPAPESAAATAPAAIGEDL